MSASPILVDANNVVYLLLASDRTVKARQLYKLNSRWVSESFMPNTPLFTNDKPLRNGAPELTMSLDEALAQ